MEIVKEGIFPVCGGTNLEWGDWDWDRDTLYIDFKC